MRPFKRVAIRPAAELYLVPGVATALCATGLLFLGRQQGVTWLTIGLGALTAIFAVAFLDSLVSKIDLRPDALVIIELHRRRSIARQDIESAKGEAGAVFLKLRDGSSFKLPETGRSQRRVLNAVTAWLSETDLARPPGAA